jgi:hypothetical protein
MKEKTIAVQTADGDGWEFNAQIPENYEEAVAKFGERGAFEIFRSGLMVKIQNIGREGFRKGKTQEEVEETVESYRPGGQRSSVKQDAFQAIVDNAVTISQTPGLNEKITEEMYAGKAENYQNIIDLIKEAKGE